MMGSNHQAGIAGGTLSGIWASVSTSDLWSTIIMAAVGAVVSYVVSSVLKRMADHPPSK